MCLRASLQPPPSQVGGHIWVEGSVLKFSLSLTYHYLAPRSAYLSTETSQLAQMMRNLQGDK